jgi:predicted ribosomally synthesized peptide with SipW-like signal peptide
MIGAILGGLFVTAVFLYPALQLKKRDKWVPLMGVLMLLAGVGLVGITAWFTQLATSLTSVLVVGAIALVLFAGIGIATVADLSDKKLDYPWNLFMLPSLMAVVLITGGTTVAYLTEQVQANTQTITSQMNAR